MCWSVGFPITVGMEEKLPERKVLVPNGQKRMLDPQGTSQRTFAPEALRGCTYAHI